MLGWLEGESVRAYLARMPKGGKEALNQKRCVPMIAVP